MRIIIFFAGMGFGCLLGLILAALVGCAGAHARDEEYREELERLKREYPHAEP
jgi:hypothetical protein